MVGIQSFGGGAATLAIIQREFIDRRQWISEERFTRDWALCQAVPGINLLALAVLIGRRLGGRMGIISAMIGMLIPSFLITLALTVAYSRVQNSPLVEKAIHGVIPAVTGLGLATAYQMGKSLLRDGLREGTWMLALLSVLIVLSILGSALFGAPVVAVLLGCGLVCSLAQSLNAHRSKEAE